MFGLNDKTEPYAERWIKWANENTDKAKCCKMPIGNGTVHIKK